MDLVAAELAQHVELAFRLDRFSDDAQGEAGAQCHDRLGDGDTVGFALVEVGEPETLGALELATGP